MSKFAWVTLTTNDTYSLGALVLAYSLKRTGTAHQLAVLITPGVSESMRNRLKDVYNVVQEVNVMDSQDAANLALLARPELGITFTKLHCWRLMQFEKCVFLDSDTLVLQNCDELFEREELSAAPDVSWPDCFNSGVFVYKPSLETFAKITEFAMKNGSFDGGDQGLLNSYFADWAQADIKKHLPFVYNVAAYASYCYLPAFKQFRDKIKILHFAGKMKPWLIQFNSQSKTACTPTEYAHAADLIQLWWNIFCDNVHQNLTDSMKYWPTVVQWVYFHHNHKNNDKSNQDHCEYITYENEEEKQQQQQQQNYQEQNQMSQHQFIDEIKEYHDPWEDYYKNLEKQNNEQATNEHEIILEANNDKEIETVEIHEVKHIHIEVHNKEEEHFEEIPQISSQDNNSYNHNEPANNENIIEFKDENQNDKVTEVNIYNETHSNNESSTKYEEIHRTTTYTADYTQSPENIILDQTSSVQTEDIVIVHTEHASDDVNSKNEAGLAGALSQLRLGEQRTPEQEAYEQLMRRQCWESGQIDYSGKDSFDNIWKKITETLEQKPVPSPPKQEEPTEFITSADIEDGKKEYDPVTKATTVYKHIEGGYEMIITTPQPNGTIKTQVKTFWDPKPVSEEDMKNEQENKKLIKTRIGKEIRIDKNTTMLTREIEGGYEEVYTTINADGTRSMRTKTFFDSVPQEINEQTKTTVQKQDKAATNKKKITKVSSVDSTDSTESRRVVQKVQQQKNVTQNVHNQQSNYTEQSTIEETRRVTQNIEITENNRTVRKNSLQEQSLKAITSTNTNDSKDSKKKKKTKSIPPPPSDFLQNDTTKVVSKRVPGGVEYTYSTQLESGKTITTSKTVYEEEEVELTEEEIKEYKKTLKDAEKHKNVTTTKKLRSESGTKKVVPSENPGDVTTVETIKIQGGTEYHYTTVTSEGIVKKAVKTVYDPVPTTKHADDETDEEEIVEEYEEEIIEPGEKNIRTIETIQKLPQKFEEEVTITHEKKEKKVKKSMMISH